MEPVIEARNLSKRYGQTVALDRLTLNVERGEVFGFLGPNGAGKTTTVRLMLGIIKPSDGRISVFGMNAWSDAVAVHRNVAYIPGELSVWPQLTGGETLELLGAVHGQVDVAYREELCERLAFDPSKKSRFYSKGNRQKIALIAALMTRADLLVLDEPTAGLDPLMERTFRECVGEATARGQTVFLSSHILSEVEALCDRVGILRGGRLVDVGTLSEMRHLSRAHGGAPVRRPPPRPRRRARGGEDHARRPPAAARGAREHGSAPARALRVRSRRHRQPGALVGGDLRRPLRRRRGRRHGSVVTKQWRRVTRHGLRSQRNQSIAWIAVIVATGVATVRGYLSAYPSPMKRAVLATTVGSNVGFQALYGKARNIGAVGGFTTWRLTWMLATLTAVWGLLVSTRLVRGEEEIGRRELLLAGPVSRGAAARGRPGHHRRSVHGLLGDLRLGADRRGHLCRRRIRDRGRHRRAWAPLRRRRRVHLAALPGPAPRDGRRRRRARRDRFSYEWPPTAARRWAGSDG